MRPFDLREALRYMGVRGEPSAEMLRLAQQGETLLRSAAHHAASSAMAECERVYFAPPGSSPRCWRMRRARSVVIPA